MFNESQKLAVKQLLESKAWGFIETMLEEEANEAKKIKTEGRRFEDIAIEAHANDKVSKAIKSLLRKLNAIKNETKTNPVTYRW